MAWSDGLRRAWWVPLAVLAGCSGGYGWSEARLSVDADGVQTVEFGLGRCMADRAAYQVDVRETDDEVRIGVDGDWSDDSDCAFGDVVELDAPLGDREVVLTGPDHRYRACEDSPGTGPESEPGSQLLCRDGEGTAEATPLASVSPFEGLWILDGSTPPVWLTLTHTDELGSFRLVGSGGCNGVEIAVEVDRGGGWLDPVSTITEAPCGEQVGAAERRALIATGPVMVDETIQSTLRLGPLDLRRVADARPPEEAMTWPGDADEAGRWELGPRGATGELPTTSACWWLSRWDDGAYVDEWILVDGERFGATDRHVAFEHEQAAVAAGACGEVADEPHDVGLPLGLAAPGAYRVCAAPFDGATCHQFAVVEPDS